MSTPPKVTKVTDVCLFLNGRNINDEAFDRVLLQMSCHDIKHIWFALILLSQELEAGDRRS